jgi:hypothetical protein
LAVTLELGLARVRNDRGDVAKDRRLAFAVLILRPIDEAGSRIIALVVAAMLQRWRVGGNEGEEKLSRISKFLLRELCRGSSGAG